MRAPRRREWLSDAGNTPQLTARHQAELVVVLIASGSKWYFDWHLMFFLKRGRYVFFLQIIDYHNSVAPPEPDSTLSPSQRALRSVLEQFGRLDCPTLHMLGNHCLVSRKFIMRHDVAC